MILPFPLSYEYFNLTVGQLQAILLYTLQASIISNLKSRNEVKSDSFRPLMMHGIEVVQPYYK